MRPGRTYRCLNCLEQTVARGFDVSHLSISERVVRSVRSIEDFEIEEHGQAG